MLSSCQVSQNVLTQLEEQIDHWERHGKLPGTTIEVLRKARERIEQLELVISDLENELIRQGAALDGAFL